MLRFDVTIYRLHVLSLDTAAPEPLVNILLVKNAKAKRKMLFVLHSNKDVEMLLLDIHRE